MRKYTSYILHCALAIVVAMAFAACEGDWDSPDLTNPAYGNNDIANDDTRYVTIGQLKAKYSSAINGNGFERITEDKLLPCTVIGNDIGGNIYKQILVQDATGAMVVGINSTGLFAWVSVGQQILIDLKGLCIGGYGKQAQLGDEYNGSIGRMSAATWELHVRILPSHDISKIDTIDFFNVAKQDIDRYCGHLVVLKDITIGDAGIVTYVNASGKTVEKAMVFAPEKDGTDYTANLVYNGSSNGYVHHSINNESMNSLLLRTSTYAKFASLAIPTTPTTIYGIATRFNNVWQILIRDEGDIKVSEK